MRILGTVLVTGGVLLLSQRLGARDANRMRRTAAMTPSATSIPLAVASISGRLPYRSVSRVGRSGDPAAGGGSAAGRAGISAGVTDGSGLGSLCARRFSRIHSLRLPMGFALTDGTSAETA